APDAPAPAFDPAETAVSGRQPAMQPVPVLSAPRRLVGMDRAELEALVQELGEPAYRGRQLAHWLYRRGARRVDEMTDLPAAFPRRPRAAGGRGRRPGGPGPAPAPARRYAEAAAGGAGRAPDRPRAPAVRGAPVGLHPQPGRLPGRLRLLRDRHYGLRAQPRG